MPTAKPGTAMKKSTLTAVFTACALLAGQAFAATAECEAKAAEKKLAGAAKNSFIKKCETDMTPAPSAACDKSATDKKLAGAARKSHVTKCTAIEKSAKK
jgi:hypothetical protein